MKSKSDRKTPAKTASNYEKRHTDDTQQQTMTPEDTPKHTGSDPNEINTQSFNQSLKEYAKYYFKKNGGFRLLMLLGH